MDKYKKNYVAWEQPMQRILKGQESRKRGRLSRKAIFVFWTRNMEMTFDIVSNAAFSRYLHSKKWVQPWTKPSLSLYNSSWSQINSLMLMKRKFFELWCGPYGSQELDLEALLTANSFNGEPKHGTVAQEKLNDQYLEYLFFLKGVS